MPLFVLHGAAGGPPPPPPYTLPASQRAALGSTASAGACPPWAGALPGDARTLAWCRFALLWHHRSGAEPAESSRAWKLFQAVFGNAEEMTQSSCLPCPRPEREQLACPRWESGTCLAVPAPPAAPEGHCVGCRLLSSLGAVAAEEPVHPGVTNSSRHPKSVATNSNCGRGLEAPG